MIRSTVPGAAAACAAALLLAGCTDGGTEPTGSASGSSAPASAAASPSGSPAQQAGSAFCTSAQQLLDRLVTALSDEPGSASVRAAFEQAADGFRSIEPPQEIQEDWTALGDGLDEYGAAFADLDESDPASVAAFQQRTGGLQGDLTEAATAVETYLGAECGLLDVPPSTGSSAPGSSTPGSSTPGSSAPGA